MRLEALREVAADARHVRDLLDRCVADAAHRPEALEERPLASGADAVHVTGWGRNPFKDFFKGPLPNEIAAYRANARVEDNPRFMQVLDENGELILGGELALLGVATFGAMWLDGVRTRRQEKAKSNPVQSNEE